MSPTRAGVLAALQLVPLGITTAALADQMCAPRYAVSSILSKLAAYGLIDKAVLISGHANGALWKPKAVRA